MKRFRIVSLLLILALLLTGCSGFSAQELYCLPEAPEDYYDLQEALSKVIAEGLSYHAPASGAHRETVQLVDLDSDGVDEAVAFFRSDADGAVKTYIFSKQNDIYETAAIIDCAGSAVASVEYADLDGVGGLELLLSCQVSETVTQALQVCRYSAGDAATLETIPCSRYTLTQLEENEGQTLFCFSDNGSDAGTVRCYRFQDQKLTPEKELKLSGSYGDILQIREIVLEDGASALAVSSAMGENQTVYDVFSLFDGAVAQTKPDGDLLLSENIRGGVLYPEDMDGDGKTEIPRVEPLPAYGEGATAQCVVVWYGLNARGDAEKKALTYHDFGGKWYLDLPESWQGEILVKQNDTATAVSTVSSAIFYRLDEKGKPGEELLTIYTLKGAGRQEYAEEQGLSILYSSTEVIYAAGINDAAALWEGTITMAEVSDGFHPMEQ